MLYNEFTTFYFLAVLGELIKIDSVWKAVEKDTSHRVGFN